jgi:hypothetical protein
MERRVTANGDFGVSSVMLLSRPGAAHHGAAQPGIQCANAGLGGFDPVQTAPVQRGWTLIGSAQPQPPHRWFPCCAAKPQLVFDTSHAGSGSLAARQGAWQIKP